MKHARQKARHSQGERDDGSPRLMVMAGGSGGHVFPEACGLRTYLQSQGWEIRWLDVPVIGWKLSSCRKHGIDIDFIEITGLRGQRRESAAHRAVPVSRKR